MTHKRSDRPGELDDRLDALLADVLGKVDSKDPRLGDLITSLVGHLHAFVRETRPTEAEWLAGIDFLVRTGQTCTPQRNEFILLSDMLGLTSAVDDVNHAGPAGATPSSVEGPFHAAAPPRENGAWIATGPERERGQVMVVRGRVSDTDGNPIAGATVDIWQADDAGHYDSQDPAQEAGNLRGLFTTDQDGGYWFRSVVPSSYPVPTDGPVGGLLHALGRHPMRPAHIHYRVEAPGHRPVTTHVFVAGDEYLGSDAAFAVKEELIVTPLTDHDPARAARLGVDAPFADFVFDVRLVRLGESA
ncbi:6-chlorohydroxyquinol-1,2-dioxygenase [Nonomuraea phyllanthi]|uniref:6-chlorohydroxyquinol-1,2-dioxygenase n=1 Tax=Nonomuraea phyllanthi TaxID=2219224 RepID=A0A5C4WHI8_9ACTN|nr:dioxygenase [Nonomuraea phyllanthi]KAB8194067.1 6-chlorohydroxyquinol-1,2-dioxygenase [Nonomuraea phyllanthi]QFY07668.1 6-chlorohydroxyquinol-1,2-dioxygenase [Nonomuraea phyllanthi]